MLPATYLLPLRSNEPPAEELTRYLRSISEVCDLIVVDGSAPRAFAAAHRQWSPFAVHVPPDANLACANGKVQGVLTGLRLTKTERAVIADDDVRYDNDALRRVVDGLETADLVVPQNYFDPVPWHAHWDTARTLLNRATGGDFPGTLGVRTALLNDGYDGDVLFENLELMRTVQARGGACRRMPGLYVRRLPPTARHFVGQRVRQAYDELGRPLRCAFWMTVLPVVTIVARRPRGSLGILGLVVAAMAVAESGRRRAGGRDHFPISAVALTPVWITERAVCIWVAVGLRLCGGVRYGNGRIVRAATPRGTLLRTQRVVAR